MKWKKADFKILLWPLIAAALIALLYILTPRIVDLLGLLTGLLLPFIIGYVLSKAINPLADLLQKNRQQGKALNKLEHTATIRPLDKQEKP